MVHDQLRDDVAVLFKELGPQQLKNISRPIRAFVADIGAAGDPKPDDRATAAPTAPSSVLRQKERAFLSHPRTALIGVAAIALLLAALGWYWHSSRASRDNVAASAPQASPPRSALSIIVLPFANQTGNPEKAYIADALTSTITSDLSRITGAFIIPPATAFAYKGKNMSAQQIAQDAGVRFVLQGSILAADERIRVSVQLADAQTGGQLWGETFDGELSNLFALHDRITTSVVDSTRSQMIVVTARESEMRRSNPSVADLILRARALNLQPQSLENWRQMEGLLRQALALEPNNTVVMGYLASTLLVPARNFANQIPRDVREKNIAEGLALAQETRKLDPKNPQAYLNLAVYASIRGDINANRQALEIALKLQPHSRSVRDNLAAMYLEAGEPKRTIQLLTEGMDLLPSGPSMEECANLGEAYFMLGDYDAAIEWTSKAIAINPAVGDLRATLAMAYAQKGESTKARAVVEELLRKEPDFKLREDQKPKKSTTDAYRKYYDTTFLPAWRKAGLPE
jgi:TolB-like protein/cytochrome c-type biogenesis protein CcmH/NrfG